MSIVKSSFLLQPTTALKWRRHPFSPPPIPPNSLHLITPTATSLSKLKLGCLYSPRSSPNLNSNPNPLQAILEELLNAVKALTRPALMAAVLAAMVLISDPSLAASGSSSSSGSSYSYSSDDNDRSYSSSSSSSSKTDPAWKKVGGVILFVIIMVLTSESSVKKTSILKLQVGLLGNLGSGRIIQKEFDRIALTANTSTRKGLSDLLTEATLALLRNPAYCISGSSKVCVKRSINDAERSFKELSIEERGKFDEEALVNMNGKKKRSSTSPKSNGSRNEYIVVTILVAAEGVHKLPTISSSGDLNKSLQKLAAIPSKQIMAVEVLWTPQMENDPLSEKELLQDSSQTVLASSSISLYAH